MLEKSTYYVLDAQGNQLSMYEHEVDQQAVNYTLAERNIYGSARLGRNSHKIDLYTADIENPVNSILGEKYYELFNHLENVLAVINDVKYPVATGTTVDYFEVALVSVSDYYPGHALMSGRSSSTSKYRYGGANGQEKTDEVSGEGNHYTAEYWEYNPRTSRRWNVDPKVKHHESPYSTFANNPIWFTDPNGADTSNYTSTLNTVNYNKAVEFANESQTFVDFFESFASPDGENFNIMLRFDEMQGADGRSRLMYKGQDMSSLDDIPSNTKLSDFEILVELTNTKAVSQDNGKQQLANAEGLVGKTVTIIHELLLHSNTHVDFLNSNLIYDKKGNVTGVNGKKLLNDYQEYFKNDLDHKKLYSDKKPILYVNASNEIINSVKSKPHQLKFPSDANTPYIYGRESSNDYSPIKFWEVFKLGFMNDMTPPSKFK